MQELPEDLLTTDKLLYFRLDGESQATLVKIAEEMLDEEPGFIALIPFGSRTKGLEKDNSDVDIFLVGDENMWVIYDKLSHKIKERIVDLKVHVIYMKKSDYECTLGGMHVSEVGSNVLGIPLGPNRLEESIIKEMRSSMRAKEMTIESLMKSLEATEEQGSREKIPDENTRKLFIKNRMRLWKNRIIELLDFREGDDY